MRKVTPFPVHLAGPRRVAWLARLVLLAALGSCDSDPPNGPAPYVEDTSRIDLAVAQSGLVDDALFPTGEIPISDAAHPEPVAFRRIVTHVDWVRSYAFSDTDSTGLPSVVRVMVCKYQKGEIEFVRRYAPQDPTPDDSTDRVFDKYLGGDWFRGILLRRDALLASGWRVIAASEALLEIDNKRACCQAKIHGVRLRQGGSDVPMPVGADIGIDSLVHVSGPLEVVAVAENDADVVVLHDAAGPHRLGLVGARTFEGPLTLGGPGLRHFTVESFTDSSTTDSTIHTSQHGYTMVVAVDPISIARAGSARVRLVP